MGSLVTALSDASSPVLIVILAVGLTFVVIREIYTAVKWVKDRFDGYHNIKNKEEDKDEQIETRLVTLEKHDKGQYQKLNELSDEVKEVIRLVSEIKSIQTKTIVDTYKESIFRIYHESKKNGSISQTELDRFIEIVHIYREHGGDGVVDEKIYPEILNLPIQGN